MNIFNRLFKKKISEEKTVPDTQQGKEDEKIKVYDKYGQELYITKDQWKDNVLIGNLEAVKNKPDELYNMLLSALYDGFFQEVVKYAGILVKIDTQRSRAAIILGIAYMKCDRLDDAEHVLAGFIKDHGDDGVVLTNLAKVYAAKGDDKKAESLLLHALEVDPNQENGLGWYTAIQKEKGGEQAFSDSLTQIALFPGSWRAQLWLARLALGKSDIDTARTLYTQAIENAGMPVSEELLMQMSGDLGNTGYLNEIIELVLPYFQVALHGLQVGNNLIKTYVELGRWQEARELIDQLYKQNRPDWREFLAYWDTELARKKVAADAQQGGPVNAVTLVAIEGPLWCRNSSPFASLLPAKEPSSVTVGIFGSTTIRNATSGANMLQLADASGRISRSIPLFLSEQIYLTTDAKTNVLIPWAQSKGFAVFGQPYSEPDLCGIVERGSDNAPDLVLGIVIDETSDPWRLEVNIIRRSDRTSLDKIVVRCTPENIGIIAQQLSEKVIGSLNRYALVNAITHPDWYTIPDGVSASDYLLRIEQLLTVVCENQDFLEGGGLHGAHEIVEGNLFLNLKHPHNKTTRMILAETLAQMKKHNPGLVTYFKDKIMLLQKEHMLDGVEGVLISGAIEEVFSASK